MIRIIYLNINILIYNCCQRYNCIISFTIWKIIAVRNNIYKGKEVTSQSIPLKELTWPTAIKYSWRLYENEENLII